MEREGSLGGGVYAGFSGRKAKPTQAKWKKEAFYKSGWSPVEGWKKYVKRWNILFMLQIILKFCVSHIKG